MTKCSIPRLVFGRIVALSINRKHSARYNCGEDNIVIVFLRAEEGELTRESSKMVKNG